MRLEEMRLRNFRCYKDEISIRFDDLTAIVGRNDAGKSTIMEALDIFFNEAGPDENDACKFGQKDDLCIIGVFSDLPPSIILDQDAQTTLSDEHLLNADGHLEIHKIFNGGITKPKLAHLKLVAMHPTAPSMDDLYRLNNAELKQRAAATGADLSSVDKKVNAQLRAAVRATSIDLQIKKTDVPLDDGNGANFWKGLQAHLPAFALFHSDRPSTDQDPEAQDPLTAAIKEAIRQQENELNRVQEFVEQEVSKVANLTVQKLKEIDPGLANTLNPQITAKPWSSLFKVSITGDGNIPINKRGSGVRRLILLGFFRAKADLLRQQNKKQCIIYGIEEPETSQHPRNQRLLMSVLQDLSLSDQVVITTHTPMLARALSVAALRFVDLGLDGTRTIANGGTDAINQKITNSLGVLADHNVKLFIGVEGKHDMAFLRGLSKILLTGGNDLPNLEDLELDGAIIFLPLGGDNLALWTNRLQGLNRPEFHVYDRDEAPPARPKHQAEIDAVNARANCRAVSTSKREAENYIHIAAINLALETSGTTAFRLIAQPGDFDDVPMALRNGVNAVAANHDLWGDKRAKEFLNGPALSAMTPAMLDEVDPHGEVRGWFRQIGELIATAD